MNGLDLFSGIGGITLALSPWISPIAYCESDRYAQGVLLNRMYDGHIPMGPIWDDVTTLRREDLPVVPDIIYGGFPCQDISSAGNGKGLEGKRSGLFYEVIRLVKEIKPRFVFLENVPAIRTKGLLTVVNEFTKVGYDCRWTCITAESFGAPHIRERWFLLAHANIEQEWMAKTKEWFKEDDASRNGARRSMADTSSEGLERWAQSKASWKAFAEYGCKGAFRGIQGLPKPAIRRNDDGVHKRVDRLKGLGNSVVPIQAEAAFKMLMGLK